MPKQLTSEQLKAYDTDGFVRIGEAADAEIISRIIEAAEAVQEHPRHGGGSSGKEGRTESFRQLNHLVAPLRELALSGDHLPALTQLIGPNVAFVFNHIIVKHPAGSSPAPETIPWHQDNAFSPVDPPTNVAMFLALDDTNTDNGCLWAIPGSHREGLHRHGQASVAPDHLELITIADDEAGVPLPMARGEGLLMSGLTLHRSLENWTGRPRRLVLLTYVDAAARSIDDGNRPFWELPFAVVVAGAVSLDDADAVPTRRESREHQSILA